MDVYSTRMLSRACPASHEPTEGHRGCSKVREEEWWRWEPLGCTCCSLAIIALFWDLVIFLDLINYNLFATLTDRSFDICMRE